MNAALRNRDQNDAVWARVEGRRLQRQRRRNRLPPNPVRQLTKSFEQKYYIQ